MGPDFKTPIIRIILFPGPRVPDSSLEPRLFGLSMMLLHIFFFKIQLQPLRQPGYKLLLLWDSNILAYKTLLLINPCCLWRTYYILQSNGGAPFSVINVHRRSWSEKLRGGYSISETSTPFLQRKFPPFLSPLLNSSSTYSSSSTPRLRDGWPRRT